MKVKIFSFSFASVLLLTAAGSVCAQTTPPAADCPPLTFKLKKGQPTTTPTVPFRYTINYAVSSSDSSPGAETAVQIINRNLSLRQDKCVYVLFKDKEGAIQGIAQGSIPSNGSRVFATSENVSNSGAPPPFVVDYPASAADTSQPTLAFEGIAEIYSKNPKLQVAPFVVDKGAMTVVPVQRTTTATGNN